MKNFDDFNLDNDFKEDLAPTMLRQRYKNQLLSVTNGQLEDLAKSKIIWGKKYKKAQKDFFNDYFKGIKVINKKNPVYIEMPTLKKVGNGQYKTIADKKANNSVKALVDEETIRIDYSDTPELPPT